MPAPCPNGNQLLGVLCEGELAPHMPALRELTLESGQRIIRHGSTMGHVYFPISCVVSRVYTASCGHSAEMGMVGFDGVLGISLFLGREAAAYDAVVHVGGRALSMKAAAARAMFQEKEPFRFALLSYVSAMIRQISQIAVCNSLHSTPQRLSRWLLMTAERSPTNSIYLTQDTIANLLSVRRESITIALGHLQETGAIRTRRSYLEIIDEARLEIASCECCRTTKTEFDAYRLSQKKVRDEQTMRLY